MSTYLFTWNPKYWPQDKFDEFFLKYQTGEILRWSCGNTKKINVGDDFFLIKQGEGSKGIIGSGTIVSEPYHGIHYQIEKSERGEKALYVKIKFEYLSHSDSVVPILRHELDEPELSSNIWGTQGSGKTIPPEIVEPLVRLWHSRIELKSFISADDIQESIEIINEGAIKKITVNAYERNSEARRKCLEKWGYNCAVCNFHFELYYGIIGKRYIHVHHLRPISSIGAEYEIDPIEDLRPVCPNCHSMLHRQTPPLSIQGLKNLVAEYGSKY